MSEECALSLQNITKIFPAVIAVNDVSLEVLPGSVHAICGENGAGKSTLMKILAGEYSDYKGEIFINNKIVSIKSPAEAKKLGIEIIHQELSLARPISVAENILAGRLPRKKRFFLDYSEINKQTRKYLNLVGLDYIDPTIPVSSLSQHESQLVEIAKALSNEPKIIIMDEPTSSLSKRETNRLFKIIRNLKEKGLAIIYISHFLNEVFEISDLITTMRDGKKISTNRTKNLTQKDVVHQMVGRDIKDFYSHKSGKIGSVLLQVKSISRYGFFKNISFNLREGEILGICGLSGSGRSEIARALVGLDRIDNGEIRFEGEILKNNNFSKSICNNIVYLSEDRKLQGLILERSISYNISSANEIVKKKGFWLSKEKLSEKTMKLTSEIIPYKTNRLVRQLSGGNQQKVLLMKWLNTNPRILILDEPTRGVDVGAKEIIHNLVKDFVKSGNASILISSDLKELIGLSDRILFLINGEMGQISENIDFTEESLLMASYEGNGKNVQ